MLLPQPALGAIAVFVPIVEAACVLQFFRTRQTRYYCALGGFVGLFTVVYLLHVWLVAPPECNCFLKVEAFQQWKASAIGVIPRNAAILVVWLGGFIGLVTSNKLK